MIKTYGNRIVELHRDLIMESLLLSWAIYTVKGFMVSKFTGLFSLLYEHTYMMHARQSDSMLLLCHN